MKHEALFHSEPLAHSLPTVIMPDFLASIAAAGGGLPLSRVRLWTDSSPARFDVS